MRTYHDFISDIVANPSLLRSLEAALPFLSQPDLVTWFGAAGYQLDPNSAAILFKNQSDFLAQADQVQY